MRIAFFRSPSGGADYARLAVAVIIIGAALRFFLAAISHPAGDSCWHLSVARFIAGNGRIPFTEPFGDGREVFWAPPIFHVVAAAVYRFFGLFSASAAEFAVKLVSPLFGSLTLPIVFLTARKLLGSGRLAFYAVFFVAFLPIHVYASAISFVDAFVAFFVAAAIYLALCGRVLSGAAMAGLAVSSKQNALFVLPVFFLALFSRYGGGFTFVKKSFIAAVAIAITGLPWLIRNLVLLGNPFWPFLYKLIGGKIVPTVMETQFSAGFLLNPAHILQFYLEFFGVPLGNLAALSFVKLPFVQLLLPLWLLATAVFALPLIFGLLCRGRHRLLLLAWILVSLAPLPLYVMSFNSVYARFFLTAIPAAAILWAVGLDAVLARIGRLVRPLARLRLSAVVVAVVVLCAFAFSAVEVAKASVAAGRWGAYEDDFAWVRENTPEGALVGYRGQCLGYNIHRFTNYALGRADYVWVNQDFRLEPVSIVEPEMLQKVDADFVPVYMNNATGTIVYGRK